MQNILEQFLIQLGYGRCNRENPHMLLKRQGEEIAVVRIYESNEMTTLQVSDMIAQRAYVAAMFEERQILQPLRFLSIILVPDGITDYMKAFAEQLEGVWFLSKKQKRLCVFEQQSMDYWNLYDSISDFILDDPWKAYRKKQIQGYVKLLQPVTMVLIAINILVFLITLSKGDVYSAQDMYEFGAVTGYAIFEDKEYWRLVTSMFLHFGISHLGSNMISLIALGNMLEKRLGHIKYAILYMVSGIGAAGVSTMLQYIKSQYVDAIAVSAGASGAIFGVIGGLIWMVCKQKWCSKGQSVYEEIPMKSLLLMTFFSLFSGFTTAGVDNAAHVGGLIIGFLFSFLLARKR